MKSITATDTDSSTTPPPGKLQIFVVDDHALLRRGLRQVLDVEPDLQCCGEAGSAGQALERLRAIKADAVVLDISLPGANGIELVKQLRAEHPKLPILVLSMHDESRYALRALRAGAGGYVMKTEDPRELVEALRKILNGKVAVSRSLAEQLIYRVAQGSETGAPTPVDELSDRELEVLQLVGAGRSSREIAELLHLSIKTVESHRLHVREKLGLPSAPALVRFAVNWVEQQE